MTSNSNVSIGTGGGRSYVPERDGITTYDNALIRAATSLRKISVILHSINKEECANIEEILSEVSEATAAVAEATNVRARDCINAACDIGKNMVNSPELNANVKYTGNIASAYEASKRFEKAATILTRVYADDGANGVYELAIDAVLAAKSASDDADNTECVAVEYNDVDDTCYAANIVVNSADFAVSQRDEAIYLTKDIVDINMINDIRYDNIMYNNIDPVTISLDIATSAVNNAIKTAVIVANRAAKRAKGHAVRAMEICDRVKENT